MSKTETKKKEAIESSRQLQLIDEAEADPKPDQAQLRLIRENQRNRQRKIEEKKLLALKEAEEAAK